MALITVDKDAENCIVVASGANLDFTDEDITASEAALRSCDILLMQLEIPVPTVLKAARIAHEAGAFVVLNPAPYAELPEEIFKYISLFIPNETELASFSGMPVSDKESAAAAASVLFDKGVGNMIVTMGRRVDLFWTEVRPQFV